MGPIGARTVVILAAVLLVGLVHGSGQWTHSWDTVGQQMMVDFAGRGYRGFPTDEEWEFIANNYAIVSLEKCFATQISPYNEVSTAIGAVKMKAANPNVKVLFYFHSMMEVGNCYRSGAEFDAHPEWWLYLKNGQPKENGGSHWKYFDLTQEIVREFVANASSSPDNASTLFDGVFADGAANPPITNCNVSSEAITEGHHLSLNHTRAVLQQRMRPDAKLFGNALSMYSFMPRHGLSVAPFVDGMMFEHFMAFESIDRTTGWLNPTLYAESVETIISGTSMGNMILVRGWPGPVVTPITSTGPSYSPRSGLATPKTFAERQSSLLKWFDISLAGYLIAASELTFWSYDWWYTLADGVVPCPKNECSGPTGWYPQLKNKLGKPLAPHSVVNDVYTRRFQCATVLFNANNVTASSIEWHC